MSHEREPAALLRSGMAAEARTVTAGPAFTERVIEAAQGAAQHSPVTPEPEQPPRAGQPAWRGWLLPAAAAAVAAVLLAAALAGAALLSPDRQQPAVPLPSPSVSAPTPGPSPSHSPSPSPAPSSSVRTQPAIGGPMPAGFWAVDLTWVSVDEGWALGTSPCGRPVCTAIGRTVDGGKTWVNMLAPPAGVEPGAGCVNGCITHLRFANPQVGYAYGSDRLYMTTDGGRTWALQPGHADALEVGDGSVIRVTTQDERCLPGCLYRVQRAEVGSSDWQDVSLPPGARTAGVELVRSGPVAAIATYAHTAGGAQDATSTLFLSSDGGASWSARPDPCPRWDGGVAGGEVDTTSIAIGADRSVTVLCTARGAAGPVHTMTSTDGGHHFTTAPDLGPETVTAVGAASAKVLFLGLDGPYRSTDGGRNWEQVFGVSEQGFLTAPGRVSQIGFQTPTVGRMLELRGGDDPGMTGSVVWTTSDAGKTWSAYPFR